MAGSTRLELATSGVTGRRSNQLNYDPDLKTESHRLTADDRPWLSLHARSKFSAAPDRIWLAEPTWLARPKLAERAKAGGRYRTRTCDSRRVKPVLYQLS